MGNCVSLSIPLDHSVNKVSQWLEKIGGYTHNLEKNLTALETTMEDLKAKRGDLSRKLNREEDTGLQRLDKFQVWLSRVETIEKEVNDILSARNVEIQRLCLCGFCSKRLLSSYCYGKSVFLTLRKVEKLKNEDFNVVAEQALTPEVEEIQLQSIIVGQETMLEKAWKHLMEDEVGIMGMYGMGGVGKTTLLTQINNKFSNNKCGFDFVIWVVVSKELDVEKIQNDIAQKVGLGGRGKVRLYNFLRKKRFVLFLDDRSQGAEQFLSSQRLMSCTQFLWICDVESSGISLLDKHREFIIQSGSISEIKMGRICSFLSLSEVRIGNCKGLRELTFLMFAPNLRLLAVNRVHDLEDIINKEKACEVENSGILPFPKLSELNLWNLQKLKNIYWSPLPFPCLEEIKVSQCPNLKKLPLDSKSGKHGGNGLIITYDKEEWIEGVEWEDEATKSQFLASCQLEG